MTLIFVLFLSHFYGVSLSAYQTQSYLRILIMKLSKEEKQQTHKDVITVKEKKKKKEETTQYTKRNYYLFILYFGMEIRFLIKNVRLIEIAY